MCVYVCVCACVYVWDLKLHLQNQETSRSLFYKENKRVWKAWLLPLLWALVGVEQCFQMKPTVNTITPGRGNERRSLTNTFFFGLWWHSDFCIGDQTKSEPISFFLSFELLNAPSLSPLNVKNHYLRTAHKVGLQNYCTFARTLDCLCVCVCVCICVCVCVCVCVFGCQMRRTRRHPLDTCTVIQHCCYRPKHISPTPQNRKRVHFIGFVNHPSQKHHDDMCSSMHGMISTEFVSHALLLGSCESSHRSRAWSKQRKIIN